MGIVSYSIRTSHTSSRQCVFVFGSVLLQSPISLFLVSLSVFNPILVLVTSIEQGLDAKTQLVEGVQMISVFISEGQN